MGILKRVGEMLSPNDPELVRKTLARIDEQDKWNDVFATKLIELLDKIDGIKSEIREQNRQASNRLDAAERAQRAAMAQLEHSRRLAENAAGGLRSAEEMQATAARLWTVTLRLAVLATAALWITGGWILWMIAHTGPLLWAASAISVLTPIVAIFVVRGVEGEIRASRTAGTGDSKSPRASQEAH